MTLLNRNAISLAVLLAGPNVAEEPDGAAVSTYRQPSRDGRGKVYMGREISQTMSYHGIPWLETLGFLPSQHFLVFRKPE